ncbi:MAG: pectate lyase [Paludibacter sp.]
MKNITKKGTLVLVVCLFCLSQVSLNAATVLNDSWSNVVNGKCSDQTTGWWSSAEAIRITNNVLLYQKDCGGWSKNINMQLVLTDAQKAALIADKPKNTEACIDNSACLYELLYLSKVYKAISSDSIKNIIKTSFTKGILYYLKAQYANGGWPQFYPLKSGYYTHITYNDNAMVNVMNNLKHIYLKDTYYSITLSDSIVNAAKIAFDKGVNCILKTQYIQKFKLATWCAQHDEKTLLPANARAYELASLSGAESANIIKLLMGLSTQSKEIKRAIYSSVAWYDGARIKGQRLETFTNSDGLSDKRIVLDATAGDMWARFYTLPDNRPFFCDRDGIMKFSLAEIGYERRNGYSWYNTSGNDVMAAYSTWLPKYGSTILASPLQNASFKNTDTIPVMAFANKYTGSTLSKFDLIIDNQLSQTFTTSTMNTPLTGLKAGSHTIIVKSEYANGAIESDTCNIKVTGTNATTTLYDTQSNLICYPNPTATGFTIDQQGKEMASIQIFNLQGQQVFSAKPLQTKHFINKNTLSQGIYLVRTKDINDNLYARKVVVEP